MIYLLALLILMPLAVFLNAYVLSVLWLWFIVPLGMPVLSLTTAVGIAVIVSLFQQTHQSKENDKTESAEAKIGKAFSLVLAKPLGALAVGWLITLFM